MIEPLARFGFASKAFVYLVVGVLAASAALKKGGAITDTSGALKAILSQPLGNTILFLLAAGLCGYALWRVLDALFDPDRHGTDPKGLAVRIGSLIRAVVYGALGLESLRLARGLRGSSGDDTKMWIARVMDLPLGDWIVALTGAIIVIYAVSEVASAIRPRKGADMDVSSLPRKARGPLLAISRFGVAARAVILSVAGVFLVRAGIRSDPSEAHNTRESMLELAGAFQGRWLLLAIALGLLAYAVDQALQARCRRIRSPIG